MFRVCHLETGIFGWEGRVKRGSIYYTTICRFARAVVGPRFIYYQVGDLLTWMEEEKGDFGQQRQLGS